MIPNQNILRLSQWACIFFSSHILFRCQFLFHLGYVVWIWLVPDDGNTTSYTFCIFSVCSISDVILLAGVWEQEFQSMAQCARVEYNQLLSIVGFFFCWYCDIVFLFSLCYRIVLFCFHGHIFGFLRSWRIFSQLVFTYIQFEPNVNWKKC